VLAVSMSQLKTMGNWSAKVRTGPALRALLSADWRQKVRPRGGKGKTENLVTHVMTMTYNRKSSTLCLHLHRHVVNEAGDTFVDPAKRHVQWLEKNNSIIYSLRNILFHSQSGPNQI
jgi:hypothetical protein